MRVSRGQNEHDVGGRFLQRFEEGVERAGTEFVNLVDDIDFGSGRNRSEVNLLDDKIADFVDLSVRGRVDLEDV